MDKQQEERVLKLLKQTRARLTAAERLISEPLAITGMACRFPGHASTPETFWHDLEKAQESLKPLPSHRWGRDSSPAELGQGHFLNHVDRFDAPFFSISPREARSMDPQQRLALEVAWEALEDAATAPISLKNSNTGVFLGIGQNDYAQYELRSKNPSSISHYAGTGNLFCFAPGRISHLLGLNGPSIALDTACSSSLVAIHLACQSLRRGESDLALAGGVHLVLSPEIGHFLSKSGALAPDGRCKTFDGSADGFGRGEGCGIIVLKRLTDALEDKNRIYAVIKGSAVNHDGPSSGFTVPNEKAQASLIRTALKNAGLEPKDVGYVEAHGTGTRLGDPIEMASLAQVFGTRDPGLSPLMVGSVKTNIGHLEAAAGIAGLMKTILSIRHRQIPPHLNFALPNPLIPWDDIPIQVPACATSWPAGQPLVAGVSSFGMSGTNAHLVVTAPPDSANRPKAVTRPRMITLSARTEKALRQLCLAHSRHLSTHPDLELRDIERTLNLGRSHFRHRLALTAEDTNDLSSRLKALAIGENVLGAFLGHVQGSMDQKVRVTAADLEDGGGRIAEAYCRGSELDWSQISTEGRPVSLPLYPFEDRRHWIDVETVPSPQTEIPMPGRQLNLPFSDEIRFELSLGAATMPHLAEHKLYGRLVVPAVTWTAMILSAARTLWQDQPVMIQEMTFHAPLFITRQAKVQMILKPDREGIYQLSIAGRESGRFSKNEDSDWQRLVQARLTKLEPYAESPRMDPGRINDLTKDLDQVPGGIAWQENRRNRGCDFGPGFLWVSNGWLGKDIAYGRMDRPPHLADPPGAPFHPGLLDSCLQLAARLHESNTLTDTLSEQGCLVPVHIGSLCFYSYPESSQQFFCRTERTASDSQTTPGMNLTLFDDLGCCVAEVRDSQFKPLPKAKAMEEESGISLFTQDWQRIEPQDTSPAEPGSLLVLDEESQIGPILARHLTAWNGDCYLNTGNDLDNLAADPEKIKGIIFVSPAVFPQSSDNKDVQGQFEPTRALLRFVQSLYPGSDKTTFPALERLWIITRGAVNQCGRSHLPDPAQAALWGMARVMDLEFPNIPCTCIDLDPEDHSGRFNLLVPALTCEPTEDRILLTSDALWVPRLSPMADAPDRTMPGLDPSGAYMITGGFGGLGLAAARQLARNGASHFILVGPRPPKPGARRTIEALEKNGCTVTLEIIDPGNYHGAEKLMESVALTARPLKGIIHAAGLLADSLIKNTSEDQLFSVMKAKAAGAYHLHELTQDLPLDFFILFSSTAGIFGATGQGIYAAANAFLDGLAHRRKRMGLCATSINWGPWENTGMTANTNDATHNRWIEEGMQPLTPDQGCAMLSRVMDEYPVQAGVLGVDWHHFTRHFGPAGPPKLLEQVIPSSWSSSGSSSGGPPRLRSQTTKAIPDQSPSLPTQLLSLSKEARSHTMAEHIKNRIATTMGMEGETDFIESRTRLFEMGIDSVTALELQATLETDTGMDLPATLIFDYPTVEDLTIRLLKLLAQDSAPQNSDPKPLPPDLEDSIISSVQDLAEEEILNQLIRG